MAAGDQAVEQAGSHIAAADKTDFRCFHFFVDWESERILPNIGSDLKITSAFFMMQYAKVS
jgi:hypothetical protein